MILPPFERGMCLQFHIVTTTSKLPSERALNRHKTVTSRKFQDTPTTLGINTGIWIFLYFISFCIVHCSVLWPTNAQLSHKLSLCYTFRHYRVILRETVISTLPNHTRIPLQLLTIQFTISLFHKHYMQVLILRSLKYEYYKIFKTNLNPLPALT
jgi:hypothetical protein